MEGEGERLEGEREERRVGFRGEDCDVLRVRRVRDDVNGERCGCRVEQCRMHDAVFVAVAVPQ